MAKSITTLKVLFSAILLFAGVSLFAQPANDLCANAITIACGTSVNGTTIGSTFDNAGTCVTSNTAPGVWYKFVSGNAASVVVETCGSSYDTKLSVFSGDCGALVCVGGNDDACGLQSRVTINNPTVGGTYYVLVHGFSSATGNFVLSVSGCGVIPTVVGDNCADALAITCGYTGSGSTIGATVDAAAPSCGGVSATGPGVWYKFTPTPANGMFLRLSTCGQGTADTKITVYTGSCGNLVCLGSNDNGAGCPNGTSEMTFRPIWNRPHYVLVQTSTPAVFGLTFTCNVSPFGLVQETPGDEVGTGKFGVYPNPTQGELNVNLQPFIGRNAIMTVMNSVGQVVFTRDLGEIQVPTEQLNLDNLQSGMYFMSVRVDGEVHTEKFMVNKNRP